MPRKRASAPGAPAPAPEVGATPKNHAPEILEVNGEASCEAPTATHTVARVPARARVVSRPAPTTAAGVGAVVDPPGAGSASLATAESGAITEA